MTAIIRRVIQSQSTTATPTIASIMWLSRHGSERTINPISGSKPFS